MGQSTTIENVPPLQGKTIETAYIDGTRTIGQTLFIQCTDGTLVEVSGFQEEGYGMELFVEVVTLPADPGKGAQSAP